LGEFLAVRHPAVITGELWKELLTGLAPVSESYLRELLLQTGLPFEQPYAGVRQHTLDELEASLSELLQVYREAIAAGNRPHARYVRRQVIGAKDRARFLASNPRTPPDKQGLKREMVEWMMTWLENPEIFPAWVMARKQVLARSTT
jgi:hypothetical protein